MDKKLFDLCYEILSHYFHFPEVNDTMKSIGDGLTHWRNYPQNDFDFQIKRGDIIAYIQKARLNNIIYQCQAGKNLFNPATPSNKTLFQDDRNELCVQLENEIIALTLKGIHQVVKRYYPEINDDSLSEELLHMDENSLQKYGLQ